MTSKTSTAVAALKSSLRAVSDCREEIRALPVYDDVPSGHSLFKIEDDRRMEPHLHGGDWVVVDTRASGRRIVWGELYFVLQGNGPVLWQVNRCTRGVSEPCAHLDPLNIYRGSFADLPADATRIVHLSDGPLQIHYLRQNLLGRVVGLFDPRERADRQREAAQLEYLLRKKRERDGGLAP